MFPLNVKLGLDLSDLLRKVVDLVLEVHDVLGDHIALNIDYRLLFSDSSFIRVISPFKRR